MRLGLVFFREWIVKLPDLSRRCLLCRWLDRLFELCDWLASSEQWRLKLCGLRCWVVLGLGCFGNVLRLCRGLVLGIEWFDRVFKLLVGLLSSGKRCDELFDLRLGKKGCRRLFY